MKYISINAGKDLTILSHISMKQISLQNYQNPTSSSNDVPTSVNNIFYVTFLCYYSVQNLI